MAFRFPWQRHRDGDVDESECDEVRVGGKRLRVRLDRQPQIRDPLDDPDSYGGRPSARPWPPHEILNDLTDDD